MKAHYSVTFEFDEVAPVMERGSVEGHSLPTLVYRAAREAKDRRPNMYWRSVVLTIERDEPPK